MSIFCVQEIPDLLIDKLMAFEDKIKTWPRLCLCKSKYCDNLILFMSTYNNNKLQCMENQVRINKPYLIVRLFYMCVYVR